MKRVTIAMWIVLAVLAWSVNASWAQDFDDPNWTETWVAEQSQPVAGYVPAAQGSYEAEVYTACAVHGCDPEYVIGIMNCESGQDPNAYHPNPYGGADVGIMQINDATWGSIAYADPYSQIWWSAEMIGNGMGYHWTCG